MTDNALRFFKALANDNRLKILGLLAQQEYTGEELATILSIQPATVSHHLARLAEIGLVSARAEGYYSVYALSAKRLRTLSDEHLSTDAFIRLTNDLDLQAFESQVLHEYIRPNNHLQKIPHQIHRRKIILAHIVRGFKPGVRYSEGQVDRILRKIYEDPTSLRAELLDQKFLTRDGDGYWRGKLQRSSGAGYGIWD